MRNLYSMSYVDISVQDLEDWLDTNFSRWKKAVGTAGVYYIQLSDNVGVKLSSTQKSTGTSMGHGQASMNLNLVSLVDGSNLNTKDRDRKHFQRTTNWRKTWKEGVGHWIGVYNKNPGFYEKIADRAGYKAKWLAVIDSIPAGGSNPRMVEMRNTLEEGGVLWDGQEQYLLDAQKATSRSKRVDPILTRPLPVDELRQMYVLARRMGDEEAMDTIKDLGLKARDGVIPTLADVVAYKAIKKELGL